mmetsp:Transcript_13398/g.16057  ORF Transcript_13398/g.16057 Transcript_13398/m.16057 type:complete len:84 (+) Transcript_13398:405-656(+)
MKTIRSAGQDGFGKPNRPQTPVTGIIMNEYGTHGEAVLLERYTIWKAHQRAQSKGNQSIRMTNAQLHADRAVRAKNQVVEPQA